MKATLTDDIRPENPDTPVTVKIAGSVTELRYMRVPASPPIRKVTKDYGVDVRTGEVVNFRHTESRADNTSGVAKSLRRLRDIINANLTEAENCIWLTLTYKENMRDTVRLYKDFHAFRKRLSRYLERNGHPPADYISAAEPQGRGAWHLHVILLFDGKAPFIHNSEMAKVWQHGFTKTKSLKDIDNPGLYFTAYLGDMEITDAVAAGTLHNGRATAVETSDGTSKAVIKGARLHLYPPGFNLFRCSRGIKRPEVYQTTEAEAQKIVGDSQLTYEKTIAIENEAGEVLNIVNYRTYTKGRYTHEKRN